MSILFTALSIGSSLNDAINNPGFIALCGTIFGGAGLKVIENWLGRKSEEINAKRDDRTELRDAIKGLQERHDQMQARVDTLEAEVTEWRDRYYTEQEKRHLLRLQILEAGLVPADSITVRLVDEVDSNTTFEA